MDFEIKLNNGFLNPNKFHQKGDRKPCLTGKANIGGVVYELSIWTPKPDKKAYFLVAKIPEGKAPQEQKQAKSIKQEPQVETPPPAPEPVKNSLSNCSF
jgi:hypothetical protein